MNGLTNDEKNLLVQHLADKDRDKFEYMVIEFASPSVTGLNAWGQDGWELAGVWRDTYCIFKRKII